MGGSGEVAHAASNTCTCVLLQRDGMSRKCPSRPVLCEPPQSSHQKKPALLSHGLVMNES